MRHRTFTKEFRSQIVEEILSGVSTPAVLCRKHNIARALLSRWRKQYIQGKFDNEPTTETALQERVQQLERLAGRLSMDNDLLKKALRHTLSHQEKSESSLPTTYSLPEVSKGGAGC